MFHCVVKFSQKLAFKGYPDLEYSIGESLARGDGGERDNHVEQEPADPHSALAERLWYSKTQAEQETRLINPSTKVDAIANAIGKAGKVLIIGLGEDGIPARWFAMRLSLLDILTVHHFDPVLMAASIATADAGDVPLIFSEYGQQPALSQISRQFRERHGQVVSVTRTSSASRICSSPERVRPFRRPAAKPLAQADAWNRASAEGSSHRS